MQIFLVKPPSRTIILDIQLFILIIRLGAELSFTADNDFDSVTLGYSSFSITRISVYVQTLFSEATVENNNIGYSTVYFDNPSRCGA